MIENSPGLRETAVISILSAVPFPHISIHSINNSVIILTQLQKLSSADFNLTLDQRAHPSFSCSLDKVLRDAAILLPAQDGNYSDRGLKDVFRRSAKIELVLIETIFPIFQSKTFSSR